MIFDSSCSMKRQEWSYLSKTVKFTLISSVRTLELMIPVEDYGDWEKRLRSIIKPAASNSASKLSAETSNIEALPKDPSELLSSSVTALRKFCDQLQIDTGKFDTREHYVSAIMSLYPQNKFSKLRFRISEIEQECFSGVPSLVLVAEVNDLFNRLLRKLEVDQSLLGLLRDTITLPQKILYLRTSIW